MSYLTSAALWWLLPVLGTIIVLYLMKMRRQDMRVPATFLWPKLTSDVRANAPMQRLRLSLLLILQLLAASLIVIALAGPLHRVRGLAGSATIVVLDNSASMSATDVSPTRFGAAIRRVDALIAGMSGADRLALIDVGASTRIVFGLTSDKPQMTRAMRSLAPCDAAGNMSEALRLASALAMNRPKARIVVLSDGNFPTVTDFSLGRAELVYESIGTSQKNVAITALDSSLSPTGQVQCFTSVHNFDSGPMPVTLTFKVDGNIADAQQFTIPAGQSVARTFNASHGAHKAQVRISAPGDILAADDQATIYLQGSGSVRTLLISNGNLFIERALSLNPAVRLEMAGSVPEDERLGSPGAGAYDLVVFDNIAPVPVKAAAVWSLGVPGQQFGVADAGMISHPNVLDWSHDDPVMRYADFRSLVIDHAHVVRSLRGAPIKILATSSGGALIVSGRTAGRRTLYTAWNILDSDFPLRVSFPVFVANAVAWLTQDNQRASGAAIGLMVHPGKPFAITTPGGSATLVRPDDSKSALDASTGLSIVRGIDQVGEYRIVGPETNANVAVNLLDEEASDVRPRATLNLASVTVAANKSPGGSLSEIWRPLILVVLCILAAEWWVFVRRS